jgi:hypothetical protein
MPRPSSIDRLPPQIREAIGSLRAKGHTIDEIIAHLADMQSQVSRSALGRHVQKLDALGEKLKRSRAVAEALVRELGEAPESRAARLNIEMMHSAILDLFLKAAEAEDGETPNGVDGRGLAALSGNPEGMMMLAKALESISRASKSNVEFVAEAERQALAKAKAAAAVAVETVGREQGLTGETVSAIKAKIFGVASLGNPRA